MTAPEALYDRKWAFDVLDQIDPKHRYAPNEVNVAVTCLLAARAAERERVTRIIRGLAPSKRTGPEFFDDDAPLYVEIAELLVALGVEDNQPGTTQT